MNDKWNIGIFGPDEVILILSLIAFRRFVEFRSLMISGILDEYLDLIKYLLFFLSLRFDAFVEFR